MGHDASNPDDSSEDYPSAPLPAHERTWRHPSEIAQSHRTASDVPPSVSDVGRGVVGVSVALGMCLVVGLVLLSRPTSGDSDTATVVRLTSEDLSYARIGNGAAPPMAVRVGDSDVLVTTRSAIGDEQQVDADLGNGEVRSLQVAYVDPVSSIAVLVGGETNALPDVQQQSNDLSVGQDVIVLADNPLRLRVDAIEGRIASVSSSTAFDAMTVAEGSPVVDQAGRLVGVCTHIGDRLAVLTTGSISDLLAEVLSGQ